MKRVLLRVMLLMVCVLIFGLALADDFDPAKCRLKVKTEKNYKLGDRVRIYYIVDYDGDTETPCMDIRFEDSVVNDSGHRLNRVYNTIMSSRTSVKYKNGKAHKSFGMTWSAVYVASKAGKYRIPRATFYYNGKKCDVDWHEGYLNVVDTVETPKQPKPKPVEMRLEASLSSDKVELGDTLTYRVKFLTNSLNVSSLIPVRSFTMDDCSWKETVLDSQLEAADSGMLESTILEYKIMPLRKGDFTVAPMEMEVVYSVLEPFDLFGNSNQANYARKEKVNVTSSEVRFNVK